MTIDIWRNIRQASDNGRFSGLINWLTIGALINFFIAQLLGFSRRLCCGGKARSCLSLLYRWKYNKKRTKGKSQS
nr:hypothetical protein [Moraxella catarrhalis]